MVTILECFVHKKYPRLKTVKICPAKYFGKYSVVLAFLLPRRAASHECAEPRKGSGSELGDWPVHPIDQSRSSAAP
ncbi:hypothetical protein Y032_0008g117 [Ancylostoma ceylanicum]|uniref:Uncharacterized protein n=1 Tax=Ancylostoma ceylanicum TaxID=53326 RepID=A0A016VJ84_9BILA|nr:hypothetical protein Y032_0008g117 [Ancylostoma ceylanicum]